MGPAGSPGCARDGDVPAGARGGGPGRHPQPRHRRHPPPALHAQRREERPWDREPPSWHDGRIGSRRSDNPRICPKRSAGASDGDPTLLAGLLYQLSYDTTPPPAVGDVRDGPGRGGARGLGPAGPRRAPLAAPPAGPPPRCRGHYHPRPRGPSNTHALRARAARPGGGGGRLLFKAPSFWISLDLPTPNRGWVGFRRNPLGLQK